MIEIVVASHNETVLKNNLLQSDMLKKYKVHTMIGYDNVAKAYNAATVKEAIVIYVHHDVYLPFEFEAQLLQALKDIPDDWGVIGVAGVKLIDGKRQIYGHIKDRDKEWGCPCNLPQGVDTLDELLLITKGNYKFDENLSQDFYGADICMQAKERGKKCYAIHAYCFHNSTRTLGGRTESFYKSQEYFKNKWHKSLPIATTCSILN